MVSDFYCISATTLTASYPRTTTSVISVGQLQLDLVNFEGVGVAVLVILDLSSELNNEIIQYTGVTRCCISLELQEVLIVQTGVANHNENQRVSKYEFNGVSLRRINKTHNMNEVTASNPYDADFYKIKINMALNGTNRTTSTIGQRFFEKDTIGGGPNARGTYNIPFSQVIPNFNTSHQQERLLIQQ